MKSQIVLRVAAMTAVLFATPAQAAKAPGRTRDYNGDGKRDIAIGLDGRVIVYFGGRKQSVERSSGFTAFASAGSSRQDRERFDRDGEVREKSVHCGCPRAGGPPDGVPDPDGTAGVPAIKLFLDHREILPRQRHGPSLGGCSIQNERHASLRSGQMIEAVAGHNSGHQPHLRSETSPVFGLCQNGCNQGQVSGSNGVVAATLKMGIREKLGIARIRATQGNSCVGTAFQSWWASPSCTRSP